MINVKFFKFFIFYYIIMKFDDFLIFRLPLAVTLDPIMHEEHSTLPTPNHHFDRFYNSVKCED